jgi:hypothetical protein
MLRFGEVFGRAGISISNDNAVPVRDDLAGPIVTLQSLSNSVLQRVSHGQFILECGA